jgi:2,4-dienoyl-CoA reductase-like NADH-dependent reductase (Old Yellow Enzyme family)
MVTKLNYYRLFCLTIIRKMTLSHQKMNNLNIKAMNFEPLFAPFQYKGLILKNRFVMAPMTRTFSPDGVPTQQVADYYARRAAAGVGLLLTEGTVIDRPSSKNQKDIPDFYGNAALQGWKQVADDVHAKGGKIAPQLWHVGNIPMGWAAPAPFESPQTMTLQDIQHTIKAFADAALNAKNLGFDSFEIHGAHGYLIDQFFWEVTNTRTDEYGGKTIKERSRFAVDVIKAMREAVGPDMVIIMRVSQWKQQDFDVKLAGNAKELEEWLLPLAEAGVDIFHGSQRRYWEAEFKGSDLNFAGWIKKVTGQPVITVGSVGLASDVMGMFMHGEGSETADMTEMLRRFERGDFDLVAIGRALLQDPEWVQKIKMRRFDEIKAFDAASLQGLY